MGIYFLSDSHVSELVNVNIVHVAKITLRICVYILFPFPDWISRMGIWILDGVVYHSDLLKFALKKDDVDNTLVMIVVDLSKPWSIMESLERWVDVVQRHVNSLDIPPEDMRSMEAQRKTILLKT